MAGNGPFQKVKKRAPKMGGAWIQNEANRTIAGEKKKKEPKKNKSKSNLCRWGLLKRKKGKRGKRGKLNQKEHQRKKRKRKIVCGNKNEGKKKELGNLERRLGRPK